MTNPLPQLPLILMILAAGLLSLYRKIGRLEPHAVAAYSGSKVRRFVRRRVQ